MTEEQTLAIASSSSSSQLLTDHWRLAAPGSVASAFSSKHKPVDDVTGDWHDSRLLRTDRQTDTHAQWDSDTLSINKDRLQLASSQTNNNTFSLKW